MTSTSFSLGGRTGELASLEGVGQRTGVEPATSPCIVARALYFRFLKRTTAHVMNVLTALVQPLDRLDYYDEAKEDR